jgi:hypothetical protein
MTEALEPVARMIRVIDSAGAAVTGLTLAAFTISAAYKPRNDVITAWTHGSTITDLGALLGASFDGYYVWQYTTPPVGDSDIFIDLDLVDTTRSWRFATVNGEMETKDIVSVFNAANKPVVTISNSGTLGQVTPLTMVSKRYRQVTFTFVDTNGNNINMTIGVTYTNFAFSVRSETDQTATPPKYDQITNITAGDGFVTVTILENASFFNALAEGAAPANDIKVLYELTADLVAVSGQTVSLVQSSPLTIIRREVGT